MTSIDKQKQAELVRKLRAKYDKAVEETRQARNKWIDETTKLYGMK